MNHSKINGKDAKIDIGSLSVVEIENHILQLQQPSFRAGQIFKWLHKFGVETFAEMSDIPLSLRSKLDDNFVIFSTSIEKKCISEYDNTVKYLFKLYDGEFIESVLMEYKYGYTLCVSTQVGCNMGCIFCASTKNGCVRNLTAFEILSQVYRVQKDRNLRISHVVLMGMGEPLDNYKQVIRFIHLISNKNGLNISLRNISLSTCGIVPKIRDLMKEKLPITLSVSIHAPNNFIRSKLMPVNNKWDIDELIKSCREYAKYTSRRISFEYAMIKNINDSEDCAKELALKLKGILCHINLIPINEIDEIDCKTTDPIKLKRFAEILSNNGFTVTVRRSLGSDISASCGQLRRTVYSGTE